VLKQAEERRRGHLAEVARAAIQVPMASRSIGPYLCQPGAIGERLRLIALDPLRRCGAETGEKFSGRTR